jgi:hypothetical protein
MDIPPAGNEMSAEHQILPKEWRLWLWAGAMGIATALIATKFAGRFAQIAVSVALFAIFIMLVVPLRQFPLISKAPSRRLRILRRVTAVAICLGLTVGLGYISWPAEDDQQRIQTMFAADRDRPLTDVYAVLKLDRLIEPATLEGFSFALRIYQAPETTQGKTMVMSVRTIKKQPFGWPNVVPGMRVQAAIDPSIPMEDIFAWDYVNGLDRIELGGFRNVVGAPKTLADLDRAMIQLVGTPSMAHSVSEIILVANRYVIFDAHESQFSWRKTNSTYEEAVFASAFLSFADLVAKRRPRSATDMPSHPNAEEFRVVPGQHGWLIADKENE